MKFYIRPKEAIFYLSTVSLLGASLVFKSPYFAATAVTCLLVSLVGEAVHEKLFAMKNINLVIPDEFRTKLLALEADISTIKFNEQKRGW